MKRRVPEDGSMWAILGVHSQASAHEILTSPHAYGDYRHTMLGFARAYGFSLAQSAGAFSALSPINDYWGNLRSLKSMMIGVRADKPVTEITVTTTHRNRKNAYDILTGAEPRSRLNGNKGVELLQQHPRPG